MPRTQVATRLDEPEYDRLTAYADEKGLSESEALRRAIRAGLQEIEDNDTGGTLQRAGQSGTVLLILTVGIFALQVAILASLTV